MRTEKQMQTFIVAYDLPSAKCKKSIAAKISRLTVNLLKGLKLIYKFVELLLHINSIPLSQPAKVVPY